MVEMVEQTTAPVIMYLFHEAAVSKGEGEASFEKRARGPFRRGGPGNGNLGIRLSGRGQSIRYAKPSLRTIDLVGSGDLDGRLGRRLRIASGATPKNARKCIGDRLLHEPGYISKGSWARYRDASSRGPKSECLPMPSYTIYDLRSPGGSRLVKGIRKGIRRGIFAPSRSPRAKKPATAGGQRPWIMDARTRT